MKDFEAYLKSKDFLICIDSDGCVFDTMEIKHKECFCPAMIEVWGLQPIAQFARQAWEFVNLYSVNRGINRYLTLIETFNLLETHPKVIERKFAMPNIETLREWVKTENCLGTPALEEYCKQHKNDKAMQLTKEWSSKVNDYVEKMVKNVPPFLYVQETLAELSQSADIIIVSATPTEALEREWNEHGLLTYVKAIAGQEVGTKKECIALAASKGYAKNNILMMGDALGDKKAADANEVLFYPITPANEACSWQYFYETIMSLFFKHQYIGNVETQCVEMFEKTLNNQPPWLTNS